MIAIPDSYSPCRLCPRECGIDRTRGQKGVCRESAVLRTACILPHFGEEPPISGKNGSGTVFFSGCALGCRFCQNDQISRGALGRETNADTVCRELIRLYTEKGIHNVNFVSGDHFAPHLADIVTRLRAWDVALPVILNTSGYMLKKTVLALEPYIDIYLTDFKYADSEAARQWSAAPDYTEQAMTAIEEMYRQKGFLDASDDKPVAEKGVLVRHLILPENIENSIDALSMLFCEFGRDLPLSIMSQYRPIAGAPAGLSKTLTCTEYDAVLDHASDLGFSHLYIQPLDSASDNLFFPDFSRERPFDGNNRG